MGLGDLLNQDDVEDEKETKNTEHVGSEPSTPSQYTTDKCRRGVDQKACHSCGSISNAIHRSWWKCPNDRCRVLEFKMGWREWHGEDRFLDNINWFEINERKR